ncbi:NAD(P)-binding domain-containing protein [Enterovirga rhinocerotis]|uniref:Cation diffusion facilitator CzcD-associated flavoprotein CzcO n=1 Tax=Enterovirga rhinocerotis TaxID=1339210 RepID=A0A4R7BVK1_9HYPH|nr:NAD(P)/FAD-dependent oxidoreductase [Enterovirga rhinocerotis]TDR89864.1 cation diffusion facilitator CzcD-associated flavoprotein CzcO [Enterovirga rhinocerotis]
MDRVDTEDREAPGLAPRDRPAPGGSTGLAALMQAARRDLALLNHPPASWVLPKAGPDGRPVTDVLIVGGGMCGQTAAFALLREGISNIRVVDRAPLGREGPWGTFARMQTLRSPKHLTGPDLGIPSLTFRAWWEAQYGEEGWQRLYKVPRLDWLAYLLWVREAARIPVENETSVASLEPAGAFIRAVIEGPRGRETIFARKVVLAFGRDSGTARRMPAFAAGISSERLFHSSDAIDFARFAGGRMAVLGASASAIDNAATALEAGVPEVTLFVRRSHFPQVNKSKWASFPGFLRAYASLSDEQRWGFYTYIMGEGTPPPHESVLRCARHPGFSIRFGEGWTGIEENEAGLVVETAKGRYPVDAAVIAIGFGIDLDERPELAAFRGRFLVWRDRVPAEAAVRHPEPALFPYLGDGMQMLEREPGSLPQLSRLHVFNWANTMSQAALAGDIPGLGIGATRLAQALVRDLFAEDAPAFRERMLAAEDDELVPTAYFVPREGR